jgi:hypothetical protein
MATLLVGLHVKHAFHCIDFHNAQNSSTALRGNSLYRVSPNSITKYGKWGYKSIYALKHESVCRWWGNARLLDNFLLIAPWIPNLLRIPPPPKKKIFVADIRSRTDGQRQTDGPTVYIRRSFFLPHEDRLKILHSTLRNYFCVSSRFQNKQWLFLCTA